MSPLTIDTYRGETATEARFRVAREKRAEIEAAEQADTARMRRLAPYPVDRYPADGGCPFTIVGIACIAFAFGAAVAGLLFVALVVGVL